MGVGDNEFDAAQPPSGQLAQEFRPDRLSLGRADFHAEHFASTVGVDADSDDNCNRDDATAAADLQVGGIDPQIGAFALDGPIEEGLHLLVNLLAQPGDLTLGNARHAHRLDEVINRAGRNVLDIGLLNNRRQSLLGFSAMRRGSRKLGK